MALTPSTMLALGTLAPNFRLPDTNGQWVALDSFRGKPALLVMFICNHCPYVKHVRAQLARIGSDYQPRGVGMVAINSNDPQQSPNDSPEKMIQEVKEIGYTFPYLFDESQAAAKAYRAACTPDIFLFDRDLRLVYRGQVDESRPKSGVEATGRDLRAALEAVLTGKAPASPQVPSLGCSIKWKSGNEPDYFGAAP